MGLNNIELTPSLTAALYAKSLVEINTNEVIARRPAITVKESPAKEPPVKEQSLTETWKSLGDNKKNILIVVNHNDTTHLPDEELDFITNILKACKLSLGDVAIVNTNNHPQRSYKDYTNYYKSKTILLFNVDPVSFGLPVDFPHFQVQSLAGSTFLYSPEVKELSKDKLLKSKLWVCLQRIFL